MFRPIKYYNLVENEEHISGTCYDGTMQFTRPLLERLYPDEYLIADILEKYIQQTAHLADKKFFVVKEVWKGNGGARNGGMNVAIADEILKIIDNKPSPDGLILAPFLFHYHHPGITIDLKNKVAIYLDPYGSEPYDDIPDLQKLQSALLDKGFNFLVVKAEQQQKGRDGSSCGPILTASMIKFIEEFLTQGYITTEFKAPRKTLAVDRMVQMNIRNPKILDQPSDSTVNEIGLADVDLWNNLFKEQGYEDFKNINAVIDALKEQKKYIYNLPSNWDNDVLSRTKVEFIIDFQLQLVNALLTNNKSPEKISSLTEELLEKNKVILARTREFYSPQLSDGFFKPAKSRDEAASSISSADTNGCMQNLILFFDDLSRKTKEACSFVALAFSEAIWSILRSIMALFRCSSNELEELHLIEPSGL